MSEELKFSESIKEVKSELNREKQLFEQLLELKNNIRYIPETYTDLKENQTEIFNNFLELSQKLKNNLPIKVSSEIEDGFYNTRLIEKNINDDKIYLSHTGKLVYETIKSLK